MQQTISILQIIFGIILSTLILLQAKGTGLGRSLSGASYHSRRGLETLIFKSTIVVAVIFVAISVLRLFV